MFELKVALKYLLPKRRQLSVSIISLISTLVISLVVWLILVFFSVTNGLEKIWVSKMITLTSPIRILPTQEYYDSYYYRIDSIAEASDFSAKTLREKAASPKDPYNPERDEILPLGFPKKELSFNPVAEAITLIENHKGVKAQFFEVSGATLKITLLRNLETPEKATQSTLSQAVYITSFDKDRSWDSVLMEGADKTLSIQGILLPKSFKEAGVKKGDKGSLSFYAPSTSSIQEMRQAVTVAGFYDPGIMPIGGKLVFTHPEITRLIRSAQGQDEAIQTEGINVSYKNLDMTDKLKTELEHEFKEKGISSYFTIETYKEFDFTKDLIQQLRSEKNIFSLISTIIIIVACSNIISMLIILVNDKKTEIGILRSMGASSKSIALIFGICGFVMGLIGSAIGIFAAYFTLQHIDLLIALISRLQGFQAFNPLFFGSELPSQISGDALAFVLLATLVISILSGLIPAYKASCLKPIDVLRS